MERSYFVNRKIGKVLVRAAVICCSCDIPAARKCCGFVGCNALHGCTRCMVQFPTACFGESPDFSNLKYDEWIPRSSQLCKEMGLRHCNASTQAAQKAIEKEYGVRYSILNELPYFNPSRMYIIDPPYFLEYSPRILNISTPWRPRVLFEGGYYSRADIIPYIHTVNNDLLVILSHFSIIPSFT